MLKAALVSTTAVFILANCASSSTPQGPAWTRQPTRTVDNGYIVYVGTGDSRDNERAQFKAEGMALEDLANECSFLPKGTRLEDRYIEKGEKQNVAYVKVAVEFQECTEAQKSLDPNQIKKLANASFTDQLRRYQDLEETGELPDKSSYAVLESPGDIPPAPTMDKNWSSSVHFAVMRQYVAYQKEVVILSAPTAYPPGAPQTTHFVETMQPTVGQIQQTAATNPELAKNPSPWSKIYDRPHLPRPAGLAATTPRTFKNASAPVRQSRNMEKNMNKKPKKSGSHGGHGHHSKGSSNTEKDKSP